jgi:conjugative transfer region protein (TIGR03750 family)
MVPTLIVAGIGIGVFVGGGLLRRWKRGRPDTWLYRQLQWRSRCATRAGGARGRWAAHHPLGLVVHAAPAAPIASPSRGRP